MIRAEKHEVESIAASCATGLERAWAENDRLASRLVQQEALTRNWHNAYNFLIEDSGREADALRTQLADQPEGVSHARLYMSILTACGIGVWLGLMAGALV